MIEGCDYAYGAPISPSSLQRAGMKLVGRYCVSDLAPPGRGITAAEYAELAAAKIETFVYWESSEGWMLGGRPAGVNAATNGAGNLDAAGMPNQPIVFAHDIEPDPAHYALVDACLGGAAAVIGLDRVGIYGGRHLIDHCRDAGTATILVQAEAWSYVDGVLVVADGVHLLQYGSTPQTGAFAIDGVEVDRVRALTSHYGQSSDYIIVPSQYTPAVFPDWYARSLEQDEPSDAEVDGVMWRVVRRKVTAVHDTYRYSRPDVHSAYAGPPIPRRQKVQIERSLVLPSGMQWHTTRDAFIPASRFTPRVTIAPNKP